MDGILTARNIVSALHLLTPDESLASRLIVFAGAPPLMNPQPLETAERGYSETIKALQCDNLATGSDRVKALVSALPETLTQNISPGISFAPLIDGLLIPCEPTFRTIATSPPWKHTSCKSIMVGFSPLDVSCQPIPSR